MKRKLIVVALILLSITILEITGTYALFETNASGQGNLEVGKWVIEVNGEDISVSQNITLDDFTYSQSSHTEDGYFAPGRMATFDLVIDTSKSDVSVAYELDIDDSVLEDHPNISISILDTKTNQTINDNTYSGVILLGDPSRILTLRISLNWDNQLTYDEADTSLIGKELAFAITAHFEQYIGE